MFKSQVKSPPISFVVDVTALHPIELYFSNPRVRPHIMLLRRLMWGNPNIEDNW